MKPLIASLALFALAACSSTPVEGAEASAGSMPAAPATMEELVSQYVATSGYNVTYDEPTGALLASLAVTAVGPADLNVLKVSLSEGAASVEETPQQFELIPLQYAAAPDLAETLTDLVSDASEGGADSSVKVLSDDRTNSLLVMAPPEHMQELRDLIALLDREVTAGG